VIADVDLPDQELLTAKDAKHAKNQDPI